MNDLGINRVLTEMRALQARSKLPAQEAAPTPPVAPSQESKESGFHPWLDKQCNANEEAAHLMHAASIDRTRVGSMPRAGRPKAERST